MASDMKKSRKLQDWTAVGGVLLLVLMVASPIVVGKAIENHNEGASAKATRTYDTLNVGNIATVYYYSTNTTGGAIKADVTDQLNSTVLDAANVNSAGFAGILVSGITLGNVTKDGANETAPSAASVLEIVTNITVGELIDNAATGVSWTFKVDSIGSYDKYVTGNATPTVTDWHKATSADFRIEVGFVKGAVKLVDHAGMTKAEGSQTGGNYTQASDIEFISLAEAELNGKDYQESYDNPVVFRVHGYKAGTGANPSDGVRMSMKFTSPDAKGVWGYRTGYGVGGVIAGLTLFGGGLVASPWFALKDLDSTDRRRTKKGFGN